MKAVLASTQPQNCRNIASLKKQLDIRKTKPKLEVPFKVYIYCTQLSPYDPSLTIAYENPKGNLFYDGKNHSQFLTARVIGEFICDRIEEFVSEFSDYDNVRDAIYRVFVDEDSDIFITKIASKEKDSENFWICTQSCFSFDEIKEYIGYDKPLKTFYGWHISGLKIYDKSKELSEFSKYWDSENDIRPCQKGHQCEYDYFDYSEGCKACAIDYDGADCPKVKLKRPPMSWCYVEELPEKETYSAF